MHLYVHFVPALAEFELVRAVYDISKQIEKNTCRGANLFVVRKKMHGEGQNNTIYIN
jgi:hypothetical protein